MHLGTGLAIAGGIGLAINAIVTGEAGRILSHNDTPAWVQGVGSILAVFGAAMTAVWQERRREAARNYERALEAKGLAVAIMPELVELRAFLSRLRRAVNAAKIDPERPLNSYPLVLQALDFVMPNAIDRNVDRLHLLGYEVLEFVGAVGNLIRTPAMLAKNPNARALIIPTYMLMLDAIEEAAARSVAGWYYYGEPEKQADALATIKPI